MPPGPTPLCGPGAVPGDWGDVCGFLKPLDPYERWKIRQHGAFSIHHDARGLRPKDQSYHHEVWLHLAFVDQAALTRVLNASFLLVAPRVSAALLRSRQASARHMFPGSPWGLRRCGDPAQRSTLTCGPSAAVS